MAKESRFAEIYRQQLKKDKGLFGGLMSAAGERTKERADIRRILPQSGVTGAISQRLFGKPYRSGTVADKMDSAKISRVDYNSQLTAKNTSVLPAMAKEMNLTRLNMQKLVVLAGGKASKTPTLKNTALSTPKEKSGLGIVGSVAPIGGSLGGGLFSGIGGLLGGAMSGIGSVFSGIASFFGNVGGGLLKGISSLFSGMGFLGIILLAGVGFLVSELFRNVDFGSLGESFGGIGKALKDLFTGEGSGKKGLIQTTKDNWSELVEAVDKTKNEFLNMWKAVKEQVKNIGMLFDGIGGGWGLLGMLFGVKVVKDIVGGWLSSPGKLITTLVQFLAKNPALIVGGLAAASIAQLMNDIAEGKKQGRQGKKKEDLKRSKEEYSTRMNETTLYNQIKDDEERLKDEEKYLEDLQYGYRPGGYDEQPVKQSKERIANLKQRIQENKIKIKQRIAEAAKDSGDTGMPTPFLTSTTPFLTPTTPSKVPSTSSDFASPLSRGTLTSSFGNRMMNGKEQHHAGVDIAVPENTPITSTQGGKVTFAGALGGYGNAIEIQHDNGYKSLYGHLNSISVKQGDTVTKGQQIGLSGSTGKSTGPHLHFELTDSSGKKINPATLISELNVPKNSSLQMANVDKKLPKPPEQPPKSYDIISYDMSNMMADITGFFELLVKNIQATNNNVSAATQAMNKNVQNTQEQVSAINKDHPEFSILNVATLRT